MFLLSSAFSLLQGQVYTPNCSGILAVIGYSVNDTVVIYDRVREHEEKKLGWGPWGPLSIKLLTKHFPVRF